MANTADNIICGGFVFYNAFDSANLAKVEQVKVLEISEKDAYEIEGKSCKSSSTEDPVDYEFNLWTKHDCHGTQYQNNNRTWFYFGIKAVTPGVCVKLNIVNLNKQLKMFSQGMSPVFKIIPGHLHWERIRDKPTYTLDQRGNDFTLSFHYYAPENPKAITYFAFTYPFSYTDLQNYLKRIDMKLAKRGTTLLDDIYYHRECAIKSLEGRRLDILTISSHHNISTEREDRLKHMFPEKNEERPFKFWDKKVILISARVHPGETPSSFVLNGFLNFLLNREDQIANSLRRLYVFKLIPMLNPDGVARGHYRMDTRGVNLNRVYLNPSEKDHPTIYAARSLIKYYHYSYKVPDETTSQEIVNVNLEASKDNVSTVTLMTLDEKGKGEPETNQQCGLTPEALDKTSDGRGEEISEEVTTQNDDMEENCMNKKTFTAIGIGQIPKYSDESGLYLYIDLHGHASKKGVFMYGNHFDDPEDTITCMLLPKLMSINNPNFHFTSCNFAERNMYLIDKRDGMSREGSGRVAVYKMTGLIRSYTLECNYNSGRLVNTIPARVRDGVNKTMTHIFAPPKYTPSVFEAVGAALGPSILDLTSSNPNSRLPNSQYRCLRGVKSYLKLTYVNNISASLNKPLHKDDNGISPKNSLSLKGFKAKDSCDPPDETKECTKNETSTAKKSCTVRRTTSFYNAMKRIKSTKKLRQTASRVPLKNQCVDDIENNSIICTIKADATGVKKLLKSTEYRNTKRSNSDYVNTLYTHLKGYKSSHKRVDVASDLTKTNNSSEETAIVKNGAKRLKVMAVKPSKSRSETGESSKSVNPGKTKSPAKTLLLSTKQIIKNNLTKVRKHYSTNEQAKLKQFSKLKGKGKSN